jgi:uncharacterized low-complexity protein
MKRLALAICTGMLTVAVAGPAAAAPNPNERAVENALTPCVAVISNNPNAGESAPNAETPGATNFQRVGETFCGDL